jgi:hypothetical protein
LGILSREDLWRLGILPREDAQDFSVGVPRDDVGESPSPWQAVRCRNRTDVVNVGASFITNFF